MSTSTKIAFIGGGNMAYSMIGGLINSGWAAGDLFASDPSDTQQQKLVQQFGITCFADNAQCAEQGEIVVFAAKPQYMEKATTSVAEMVRQQRPLLISISAGIRCEDILNWTEPSLALVRVMPNTPALVNAGISALFATKLVVEPQRNMAQAIMESVGQTLWVENEKLLDVVTGISGSGPAYFFKLMEQMIDCAMGSGLDQESAERLVLQTALGAATLISKQKQSPAELRRQVTSREGTTEAALRKMETLGIDDAIQQGIAAAIARSKQLGDKFSS